MQNQEFMPQEQEFGRPRSVNTDPREQRQQQAPPEYIGQEPYHETGMNQVGGAKIYPQQAKKRRGLWFILILVLIAIMALGGLGRAIDRGGFADSHYGSSMQAQPQVFQVTGTPRLVINDGNGQVHIHTGGAASTVTIREEGSRGNGDNLRVTSGEGNTGTTINVNANTDSIFSDGNVNLDITVPNNTNIDVHANDGSVDVNGVNGQIAAETTNGSIQLENVQGQVTLQSQDGSITGNNISGQVVATSNDGHIDIEQTRLSGRSSLTTTNGAISFKGSLDPAGVYSFESGDGSVDVTLPDNSSFQLTTSTNGGSLQNDFGSAIVGSAPHATLFIKTSDGSINLHKGS